MRQTPLEKKVSDTIAPVIADMGFRLVAVTMIGEGSGQILRVMAEDPETRQLNVDDCAKLSRAVGTVLDVEDFIKGAYRLELSSPGIDRPLVRLDDFEEYKGFEAKVEIDPPMPNGQKRFRGRITDIEGDGIITLDTDEGLATFPFDVVQKARLVMTDDLIKAGQERKKAREEARKALEEENEEEQNSASAENA